MSKRKGIVLGLVVVLVLAFALVAASCGSSSNSSSNSTASASASTAGMITGQLTGTPEANFTQILGHAPTGLAEKIAQRGYIIVANDPNYAPQSYVDPTTKKLIGFDVDTATTMAKILNLKIKWVHPAWETIPSALNLGQFDVSIGSMTDTKDREKAVSFTQPYYYTPAQVFVKKGGPQISGPQDLNGHTVGVGAGTTYYSYLKKYTKAIVKTYTTDLEALPDLLNGNLEFFMTAAPTGLGAINDGKPIEFSGKPVYFEALCFATALNQPDLIALFNYALTNMHKVPSGATESLLTTMSKKWYNGVDLTVTNGIQPLVF
jgi:polar amino acid transport system substrate-binding protein